MPVYEVYEITSQIIESKGKKEDRRPLAMDSPKKKTHEIQTRKSHWARMKSERRKNTYYVSKKVDWS